MSWLSSSVGNPVEVSVANSLEGISSSEGPSGTDGVRSLEALELSFDLVEEVSVLVASFLGALKFVESIQKSSVLERLSHFSVNEALSLVQLSVDLSAACRGSAFVKL